MRIFHYLPFNPIPSGGIKVHYRLAELERELGHESWVVYDSLEQVPTWFRHSVPHLSVADLRTVADRSRDLVVGWEKDEPLHRLGFRNKVMYVQGEVFIDRSQSYWGMDVWFSSRWNRDRLPQFFRHRTFDVFPFIDSGLFRSDVDWTFRKNLILVQERKAGRSAFLKLQASKEFNDRKLFEWLPLDSVKFLPDVSEEEFAAELGNSMMFFAHSSPEGLGLPPLEAMACGAVVVGFHGGGGTDYMRPRDNCFVAERDDDYDGLARQIDEFRWMPRELADAVRLDGLVTAGSYSKERTVAQLREALKVYE